MSAALAVEPTLAPVFQRPGEERDHFVCHCTDDRIAACGLDVSDDPWATEANEDRDCPLCVLAWPEGSTCPFGCACEECWW